MSEEELVELGERMTERRKEIENHRGWDSTTAAVGHARA
jgi:hypothetical protein